MNFKLHIHYEYIKIVPEVEFRSIKKYKVHRVVSLMNGLYRHCIAVQFLAL